MMLYRAQRNGPKVDVSSFVGMKTQWSVQSSECGILVFLFLFSSIDSCLTSFSGEAIHHIQEEYTVTCANHLGFLYILVSPNPDEAWTGLEDPHWQSYAPLYFADWSIVHVSDSDSLQNKWSARTATDFVLRRLLFESFSRQYGSLHPSRTAAATWQLFHKEALKVDHQEYSSSWKSHWVRE